MEFKIRLVKRQKQAKRRNKITNEFKRVKVRGRKRWIKAGAPAAAK